MGSHPARESVIAEVGARRLPRRAVLRIAAGASALVLTGRALDIFGMLEPVPVSDLPASGSAETAAAHQWAFVIDLRRCDGCGDCTKGCQEMHFLDPDQEWIRVYTMADATGGEFFLPVLCQMCERAPCVQVCPVTATYHLPDGPIVVDQSICIGCRMCMAACPYGVRTFNWRSGPEVPPEAAQDGPLFQAPQRLGTVGKCDACAHETREGRLPACVSSCAMEAIYLGDFVTDIATNGRETIGLSQFLRENDVYRLKEHLGTEPRVYYVAGHGQHLEF
jgi:molybdopterin-containing oxidoreductase family iron-sulfur binding subunit